MLECDRNRTQKARFYRPNHDAKPENEAWANLAMKRNKFFLPCKPFVAK